MSWVLYFCYEVKLLLDESDNAKSRFEKMCLFTRILRHILENERGLTAHWHETRNFLNVVTEKCHEYLEGDFSYLRTRSETAARSEFSNVCAKTFMVIDRINAASRK